MSITVSMAGGNANVQNMNPMAGQMPMSSLQMPGMNPLCSEQVSATDNFFLVPPDSFAQFLAEVDAFLICKERETPGRTVEAGSKGKTTG